LNWNLALTNGTDPSFPAAAFTPGTSTVKLSSQQDVIFVNPAFVILNPLELRLGIGSLDNLDNPMSSLSLVQTPSTNPGGAVVCYNCAPFLSAEGTGSLLGVAVPEPATLALLGVAIAWIGWTRRRKLS
jgi:hypothetical protein